MKMKVEAILKIFWFSGKRKNKNGWGHPVFFRRIVSSALVMVCAIAALWGGVIMVERNKDQSYVESLRLALQRGAVHCYAVEGRYPESLDILRDVYGVEWDEKRYVVDYEIIGANRMPVITVIPLK